MNYSNLPPDVLRIIATQSPRTYSQLARSSSSLNTMLQPVLQNHCDRPVSAGEIVRYLRDVGPDQHYLLVLQHRSDVPLRYSRGLFYEGFPYHQREGRQPNIFIIYLNDYLRQGYQPEPAFLFALLQQRLSCLRNDPTYAHRYAVIAEKKRLLRDLYDPHAIDNFGPLHRLMKVLGDPIRREYLEFAQTNTGQLFSRKNRTIDYLDNLLTRL